MIRTYSTPIIALEKEAFETQNGVKCVTVLAETDVKGVRKEVRVSFYGKLAEKVEDRIVPGVRFTYRGYVAVSGDALTLVAQTFAPIA